MTNFARIRSRCARIIAGINEEPQPIDGMEASGWIAQRERNRAIVAVGGETGSGEVIRGDVLILDWDEIGANQEYGSDMLAELHRIGADHDFIEQVHSASRVMRPLGNEEREYNVLHDRLDKAIDAMPPDNTHASDRQINDLIDAGNGLRWLNQRTSNADLSRRIKDDRARVRKALGMDF